MELHQHSTSILVLKPEFLNCPLVGGVMSGCVGRRVKWRAEGTFTFTAAFMVTKFLSRLSSASICQSREKSRFHIVVSSQTWKNGNHRLLPDWRAAASLSQPCTFLAVAAIFSTASVPYLIALTWVLISSKLFVSLGLAFQLLTSPPSI